MPRLTRKKIFLAIIIILLAIIARPVGFLLHTYYTDPKPVVNLKNGYTNDASRLNETRIEKIVKPARDRPSFS
jgi:hypothetical protein